MTWQERYSAHLMNNFGPPKLELVRGEGAQVWDSDGNTYVDLLGGIAVNSLGHAHPRLVEAVTSQLGTLGHISNLFTSEPQIQLAERLLELSGRPGKVFFSNSGAEANEAAFKLTRRTGRTHVVAAEGGFHGRTFGALALTSKAAYREPFEPLPGDVTFVPYGDAEALAAAVTDRTAAVLLEPMQGEAGVNVPEPGYLLRAQEIAHAHGALLWLDEIQTGVGRTGAWLAHHLPFGGGVQPDIVTLAKGLGGGVPIGATLAFDAAAELFTPGQHGTTFGGNPLACAAALAVLSTIERDSLVEHAVAAGDHVARRVEALGHPLVTGVRGSGLLRAITLAADISPAVTATAREAGFIVNPVVPGAIRLAPPLVITTGDLDVFVDALPGILDRAHDAATKEST